MATTIPQRDLRNDNAKVIEAVVSGETFLVTRNGEPVAELRPVQRRRQTFVTRAQVAALGGAVRIDPDRFRSDADSVVDQGL